MSYTVGKRSTSRIRIYLLRVFVSRTPSTTTFHAQFSDHQHDQKIPPIPMVVSARKSTSAFPPITVYKQIPLTTSTVPRRGPRPAPGRGQSGDHFEPCREKNSLSRSRDMSEGTWRGCGEGAAPFAARQGNNNMTCYTPLERGRRAESNGV